MRKKDRQAWDAQVPQTRATGPDMMGSIAMVDQAVEKTRNLADGSGLYMLRSDTISGKLLLEARGEPFPSGEILLALNGSVDAAKSGPVVTAIGR